MAVCILISHAASAGQGEQWPPPEDLGDIIREVDFGVLRSSMKLQICLRRIIQSACCRKHLRNIGFEAVTFADLLQRHHRLPHTLSSVHSDVATLATPTSLLTNHTDACRRPRDKMTRREQSPLLLQRICPPLMFLFYKFSGENPYLRIFTFDTFSSLNKP